jgi:hypothetical protein
MKNLIIICLVLLTTAAQSQRKTFVRIFDLNGNKTHTGFLVQTSDSSITLSSNKEALEVPVNQIGIIKLKRSFGHTILITSLIAGGAFAIFGVATADPDAWIFGYTAGEGFIAGLVGGAVTGTIVGSVIGGTTNRPVFTISGKHENWEIAKKTLQVYLPLSSR